MTDYRTQQQADALWRAIEANVEKKIAAALARPSGITPGTAYGSVIFDAAGRATWGGAGGSSGAAICYSISSSVSVPGDGTPTRIDFDIDEYDSQDPTGSITYPGGLWTYTAPLAGWYRVDACIDYSKTATWVDGDLADLQVWWTNGFQLMARRRDMRADVGDNITSRLSGFHYIDMDVGDICYFEAAQDSGSTNDIVGGIGALATIQWIAPL
jgi:hypothetical protein